MNAFRYSTNEQTPPAMKTPMIAICGLSNEGPAEGPKSRVAQLADVLEANELSFEKYNKLSV